MGSALARWLDRRWLLLGTGLALAAVLFRWQVLDTVRVESDSMAPTICAGDRLLLEKLDEHDDVSIGDLVVFRAGGEGGRSVKRVVAVAGQRVEVRDGVLYVDRQRQAESYVDLPTVDGTFFGPVVVGEHAVFVLGDHREVSIDSRDYGGVPRDRLEGTVLAHLWSACSD